MSEREFPIEPYGVAYDCDECGAEMKRNHDTPMQMTHPPKVAHQCPQGHIVWLTDNYPNVRYRHPIRTASAVGTETQSEGVTP